MKTLPLAVALTLAAWLISSIAQTATAPPLPAASAPRLLSPSALRESASPPGDLRPEDPVKPQISIPFGKKPATPMVPEPSAQRRTGSTAAAAGGINDASARCEAEIGDAERAACRTRIAQTNPRR